MLSLDSSRPLGWQPGFDIHIGKDKKTFTILPTANPDEKNRRLAQMENIEKIANECLVYVQNEKGPNVENLELFLQGQMNAMRASTKVGGKILAFFGSSTKYQAEVEKTYQRLKGANILRLGRDSLGLIFDRCKFLDLPNLVRVSKRMSGAVQHFVQQKFHVKNVGQLRVLPINRREYRDYFKSVLVNQILNMKPHTALFLGSQNPKAPKIIFDLLNDRNPCPQIIDEESKKIIAEYIVSFLTKTDVLSNPYPYLFAIFEKVGIDLKSILIPESSGSFMPALNFLVFDKESLEFLLKKNPDLFDRDTVYEMCAIHLIASLSALGSFEIGKLLFDRLLYLSRSLPKLEPDHRLLLLFAACVSGVKENVDLVTREFEICINDGMDCAKLFQYCRCPLPGPPLPVSLTALSIALVKGDLDLIAYLLKQGASLDKLGLTATVFRGCSEIAKYLVEHDQVKKLRDDPMAIAMLHEGLPVILTPKQIAVLEMLKAAIAEKF